MRLNFLTEDDSYIGIMGMAAENWIDTTSVKNLLSLISALYFSY